MFAPRVVALSFLMLTGISVSACGSSSPKAGTAAASSAAQTMPMAGGQGMKMSSRQPEHDATALAGLQAHPAAATRELRAALASRYEPPAAKRDARKALALIAQHKAQAVLATTQGAAVEHFSYALQALNAHSPQTAAGHLMEASNLPAFSRAATQSLAAIKAHDTARAVSIVSQTLHRLGA